MIRSRRVDVVDRDPDQLGRAGRVGGQVGDLGGAPQQLVARHRSSSESPSGTVSSRVSARSKWARDSLKARAFFASRAASTEATSAPRPSHRRPSGTRPARRHGAPARRPARDGWADDASASWRCSRAALAGQQEAPTTASRTSTCRNRYTRPVGLDQHHVVWVAASTERRRSKSHVAEVMGRGEQLVLDDHAGDRGQPEPQPCARADRRLDPGADDIAELRRRVAWFISGRQPAPRRRTGCPRRGRRPGRAARGSGARRGCR